MIRISKLRSRLHRWRMFMPVTVLAFLLAPHTRALLHADDGDLDTTFGVGGKVTTDFSNQAELGAAVAVQADGKIVVAGTTFSPSGRVDFGLARYLTNGSLDASFGAGGRVTTDFGVRDEARALAIQADGKIVVAGQTRDNSPRQHFALARYNADGSLDASFGAGGLLKTDFGAPFTQGAVAVAIQSDGRIVAAGNVVDINGRSNVALARYHVNGSLDTSFDEDGRVITMEFSNSFEAASAMALQADGRIVVAGAAATPNGPFAPDFALVRYNTNGSLDTTFDGDGIVTTDFAGGGFDAGLAVAIHTDGHIVVAGTTQPEPAGAFLFALARYDEDGSLDGAFGSGGKVTTAFANSFSDLAFGVALQADGKIVAAGASDIDFGVARYDTAGALDTTFGAGGTVITDFAQSFDGGRGVAVQADGRIVVAGTSNADFAVARYEGTPPQ